MRARAVAGVLLALVLSATPAAAQSFAPAAKPKPKPAKVKPSKAKPPKAQAHQLFVGAAEDAAKHHDPSVSKAKMTLARLAGYNAIRLTAIWAPGQTEPDGGMLLGLRNAVGAADLNGIRIILSVYQYGSRTTPLTPAARSEFSQYAASLARTFPTVRDFIIGNEPNLNLFWMPQFNPDGSSASPGAYVALLAEAYDALKAVSPKINVIGGSVSPRGSDKYPSPRHTHSPTRFIPEMGKAYRALGRSRPIMDTFAFHPYLYGYQPPTATHPKSSTVALNDYGKLVALLGTAFDGTAQPGSKLPIVYDEFGYESEIPEALTRAYHGNEPKSVRRVDEATLGAYYKQALELAACQPTVQGFLFFLVSDEANRDRWQSGVYYADDTPKSIFEVVKRASLAARNGTLGACASGATAPAVPSPAGALPGQGKKGKPEKAKAKPEKPKAEAEKKPEPEKTPEPEEKPESGKDKEKGKKK